MFGLHIQSFFLLLILCCHIQISIYKCIFFYGIAKGHFKELTGNSVPTLKFIHEIRIFNSTVNIIVEQKVREVIFKDSFKIILSRNSKFKTLENLKTKISNLLPRNLLTNTNEDLKFSIIKKHMFIMLYPK